MPNQRDIAKVLGVSQATISLALSGDLSIPAQMRKRVEDAAKNLGYRQNAYVSVLMSRIRSGRKASDQGTLGVVVNAREESDWLQTSGFHAFYQGLSNRAIELGFQVDCFYLGAPGMNTRRINHILKSRGIKGLIFAPPYREIEEMSFDWDFFATIACGHGLGPNALDRVTNHHSQNVLRAFQQISDHGYQRIGLSLLSEAALGGRLKWVAGFLEWQNRLPVRQRIPLFTSASECEKKHFPEFQRWHKKWRPDALLTLTGGEQIWLAAMGVTIPDDIGLASLVIQPGTTHSGINENNEAIGATAVDQVANKIANNQYGPPRHPKLILIEGEWQNGTTLIRQKTRGVHGDFRGVQNRGADRCSRARSSVP